MKNNTGLRRGDLLLLALLTAAAAVLGGFWLLHRTPGKQVAVRVDRQVVATFPLDENREYTIDNGWGGENHLVIRDGVACVDHANCPDRICVMQGAISQTGESIICLPNAVVVEIVEGDESP